MLPVLATFVVSLVVVLVVYWLFIVAPEERAGRALRQPSETRTFRDTRPAGH